MASLEHADDAEDLKHALSRYDLDALWPRVMPHLHLSEGQHKQYLSGIKLLFNFAFVEQDDLLSPARDFPHRYHESLAHLAPGTRRVRLAQARALYAVLRDLGAVAPHLEPFAALKGKTERPETSPLLYEDGEVRRLLAHANVAERAMILLGAHAGLATREITALSWEDVRVAGKTLRVRGREVAVPAEVNAALAAWARRDGGPLYAQGKVFPRQADSRALLGTLHRLCGEANVAYKAWRALRHHYALRLYQATRDAELVREQLGLASLKAIDKYRRLARPASTPAER